VTEDGPQSPATVEEPAGAEAESEELAEQLASAEDRYRRALVVQWQNPGAEEGEPAMEAVPA
jgi:hypothetical protein